MGHTGSRGETLTQRISKYGNYLGTIGECINFQDHNAKEILANLIIDDGVKGRGHRMAIFNQDFKTCGIGQAYHSAYGVCTIIDYAQAYTDF